MRDFYRGALKFLGATVLVLAIAAGILYAFFVKIVENGRSAMAPTIMPGDTVVVWKTTSLDLGDVALCPHPSQHGRFVIGRVVGVAGSEVSIDQSGGVMINGEAPDRDLHDPIAFDNPETGRREQVGWANETILEHDYRIFYRQSRVRTPYRPRPVTGGVFLLTDNRSYVGEDSRTFGIVNPATCIGVVVMRLVAGPSPPEIANGRFDLIE